MALTSKRAAFFDVDNTLIRGSVIYFLGRGMYQRGYFTKKDISRFVLANLRFRLTGKENTEEIQRFQDAATDFIGGHNVKDIEAIAQEIYDEYVSPAIWQGTIDIAQSLVAEGIEVYLVTAAPEDMAVIIAQRLGLTGALGSKAEISDGIYTGRMNGALLHGKEKAVAVTQLAKEKGFDLTECLAFSDSNNDFRFCNVLDIHQQLIPMPCLVCVQWLRVGRSTIFVRHDLLVKLSRQLLFDWQLLEPGLPRVNVEAN